MNPSADATLANIRRDRSALVGELDAAGAKWASNGKDCRCPFHSDAHPSAGIFQTEGGLWKFKCFPCGLPAADLFDVRARRLGRQPADVLREWRQSQQPADHADPERRHSRVYPTREALRAAACLQGRNESSLTVEAEYDYCDPDTRAVELIVFRLRQPDGRKTFRQASPTSDGWCLRGPSGRWPLYNRFRVRRAGFVIVVEGENKVHALTPVLACYGGWAATCNPGGGGSGKVGLADWSPLAGKRVYLWPDADPPDPKTGRRTGVEHMKAVAAVLARLAPPAECFWIDPDVLNLPPKGDAVDWVQRAVGQGVCEPKGQADRLDVEVLTPARQLRASAPLRAYYADHAAGKRYAVPWPWPRLSKATHALQPGLLTMVCGEAGAGKSFLIVESLWHWLHHGARPACLMLESAAEFHAARLHAMLAERPELLDPDWLGAHGDESEALYQGHANDLDLFWSCLETVRRDAEVTPDRVLEWLRRQGQAGARVMVVDPITAMVDDQPWVTDVKFLRPVAQIAEDYGASVVMTIHPDRGGRRMARSEGVKRCVDSIFWLARHETPRHSRVNRGGVPMPTKHNRTVRITKARAATGAGGELAYDFAGDRLRFAEIGVIVGGEPDIEQESPT